MGSIRFRSPLLTESISLSFPPLTEMFHFSGYCVSYPMYSGMNDQVLPQSGYPIRTPPDHRLLAASRGFRSLPRPSSPVGTKAFTVRPYLLHHIAKVFYHSYNTTKPFRDLLYCLFILVCMFLCCCSCCYSTTHLLESDCFSAIVFFATQMSIFVFLPISNFLVGLTGLEPVTPRLSSACSNQLSYRPGLGLLQLIGNR